jgi:hypothetical protein
MNCVDMSCTNFFPNHTQNVESTFKISYIVRPQVKYGFHYTYFRETCNCSMALHGNLLHGISLKFLKQIWAVWTEIQSSMTVNEPVLTKL